MVGLLRFSTILLVLYIMPGISPYRISSFEPYLQDEKEPNETDEEFKPQVNSVLNDYEDRNAKTDGWIENTLKDRKYRLEKRNGDLINFLLGLPKGMLDAGKK